MKQCGCKICMVHKLLMYGTCCYTALTDGLSPGLWLSHGTMSLAVVLSLVYWPTQIRSLPPRRPVPLVVLPRLPWLEDSRCLHLWLWPCLLTAWLKQVRLKKRKKTQLQKVNDVLPNKHEEAVRNTYGYLNRIICKAGKLGSGWMCTAECHGAAD